MTERHYLGQPAHLTFTADYHELLTGDLLPGRPLGISYAPARLARPGGIMPAGLPDWPVTMHVRFGEHMPPLSLPLRSSAGMLHTPLQEITTRAAVLSAVIQVPAEARHVALWFTGRAADGSQMVDDDFGRTFVLRFPSRDLVAVQGTVEGRTARIVVSATPAVERVSVRYRVVNDPRHARGEFELKRGQASGAGIRWDGAVPVFSAHAILRYKLHYWIAGQRFKEDNASAYFLAPTPPAEEVPPPPTALIQAARRFAVYTADDPQALRERAHAIWLEEGRPTGRHLDHWFAAKEEVAAKALGEGSYSAWMEDGILTIRATGTLPRGSRASLERLHGDQPGFILFFRHFAAGKDDSTVPFAVETRTAIGPQDCVLLFDRHGAHTLLTAGATRV